MREVTAEEAKVLLQHLKNIRRSDYIGPAGLTCVFENGWKDPEDPHVYAGIFRSGRGEDPEVHLQWGNIPGVPDSTWDSHYSFQADGPIRNWQGTSKEVRKHLRGIVYDAEYPASWFGVPETEPRRLRKELRRRRLTVKRMAELMKASARTLESYLKDPWRPDYRKMPRGEYRFFQEALEEFDKKSSRATSNADFMVDNPAE